MNIVDYREGGHLRDALVELTACVTAAIRVNPLFMGGMTGPCFAPRLANIADFAA